MTNLARNASLIAFTLSAISAISAATGCTAENNRTDTAARFDTNTHAQAIVRDLADEVVVPTYKLLASRAVSLVSAVKALSTETTEANLEAARTAWIATRQPWEQGEGFLFGPVDANGFDPALDSWPVNRTDLDAVLSTSDALTTAYVGKLDTTLQGFHTAEYLLFGTTSDKTPSDLTERELDYLVAVAELMSETTELLAKSWTIGTDGADPYADVFKSAGSNDNHVYPSLQAAGQEIVYGMIGILDEVANGKVADPFDEGDTTLVESQFSFNSLTDFVDNIKSVQNAYLGVNDAAGTSGVGLTDFVADVDSDLDEEIRGQLDTSIAALSAIPEPFREAILDPGAADTLRQAQDAIRAAQTSMESGLLPLVTQ